MLAALMATLERPVRLISTLPSPCSTSFSYPRLRLMGSTAVCGCIWSMRQASMTSGGTHSPSSSTNCTYSASGLTTAPKAASTVGTMRATRSMLSSRFTLPASPTALALAKPSITTALTPSLENTRLATRPATPPQKSTTMVAPVVISLCYGGSVGGEKEHLYVIGVAASTDVRPGRRLAGEHVVANDPGVGCPEVPDVDPRPQQRRRHGALCDLGGERRIAT